MRTQDWQRHTEWPLTAVALLFLVAYAWPILNTDLPRWAVTTAAVTTGVAWLAFAVDYAVRVWLAEQRWRFVVRHPVDLAVVVLPVLRPLRLLRVVALVSVVNRHAGSSLRGRVVTYAAGGTALLSFIAALAILDAERKAKGANITTFGDALWWALTTITTVGYGDRYPVTGTGRAVAFGLMLAGIALLGVITATLASWLVERVSEAGGAQSSEVAALAAEVRALRLELDRRG
jgi:voltage-gated potassium channel